MIRLYWNLDVLSLNLRRQNLNPTSFLVLKAGVSENYSTDGVARMSGKEGISGFTLKENALLDTEWLDGEK